MSTHTYAAGMWWLAQPTSGQGWLYRWLIAAISYFLIGYASMHIPLGLLMQSGYEMAIWPAAGLAVALTIAWGPKVLPALLLGRVAMDVLLINWPVCLSASPFWVGTVAGPWFARLILIRLGLNRRELTTPREVVQLIATVVAAPAIITAACAMPGLWLLDDGSAPISFGVLLTKGSIWWLGDVLGASVLAFPVLFLTRWRGELLAGRRPTLALTCVLASVVALGAGALILRIEQSTVALRFQRDANALKELLTADLLTIRGAVTQLRGFYQASNEVDRNEFAAFSRNVLEQSDIVYALEWIPVVPSAQLDAHIARTREEGLSDYTVWQVNQQGKGEVVSRDRHAYYPILFLETKDGNPAALGLDVGAEGLRYNSLMKAANTGELVASPPLELARKDGVPSGRGVMVVMPFYGGPDLPATLTERLSRLTGFVAVVVDLNLLQASMSDAALAIDSVVRLTDVTEADVFPVLQSMETPPMGWSRALSLASEDVALSNFVQIDSVDIGLTRWQMVTAIAPTYFSSNRDWLNWAVLAGAIGLICFPLGLAFVISGRSIEIARLVELRTAELRQQYLLRTQAEAEFKGLFDHWPDGLLLCDATGKLISTNQAGIRLLAPGQPYDKALEQIARTTYYRRETSSARPTTANLHPEEAISLSDLIQKTRETTGHLELECIRPDGRRFAAQVTSVSPGSSAGGNDPRRIFLSLRDVTAQIDYESGLREARDAAQHNAEARANFLSTMSHEIRTPLNGIIGSAELLQDTPLTSEQRGMFDTIRNSSNLLLNLVNDILDFSKISSGHVELERRQLSIRDVVSAAASVFRSVVDSRNIELLTHVDVNVPEFILGDAHRLQQVLVNLIGNGLKFTAEGQINVRVSATVAENGPIEVAIRVTDTGIGMEPDALQKLFQPFMQADTTISRRFGGTGLGLAICRELVSRMQGTIEADSTPGEGSTFTIRLPVTAVNVAPSQSGEKTPERKALRSENDLKGLRALVVDDNEVNLTVARALLIKLGLEVELARSGAEALDAVANQHNTLDIVLMDQQMPGMDGLEATERIRAWESTNAGARRIPIIAVTANAFSEDRERCLKAGMDDYLSKPLTLQRLSDVLYQWLARPAAE